MEMAAASTLMKVGAAGSALSGALGVVGGIQQASAAKGAARIHEKNAQLQHDAERIAAKQRATAIIQEGTTALGRGILATGGQGGTAVSAALNDMDSVWTHAGIAKDQGAAQAHSAYGSNMSAAAGAYNQQSSAAFGALGSAVTGLTGFASGMAGAKVQAGKETAARQARYKRAGLESL